MMRTSMPRSCLPKPERGTAAKPIPLFDRTGPSLRPDLRAARAARAVPVKAGRNARVRLHTPDKEKPMPFYEKGDVRIHYEEVGSGFPLMVIPGGGLNSTVAGLANHPFNPMEEFKGEYRVVAADLRNANGRPSSGPPDIEPPWGAYTDRHLGLK